MLEAENDLSNFQRLPGSEANKRGFNEADVDSSSRLGYMNLHHAEV